MYELDRILLGLARQVFGNDLAGECAKVSHMILNNAQEYLDDDITLHVGWVEINGVPYFKTEETNSPKYFNGKTRFNYHVWLEGSGYFIDLTLIDTLRDMNDFDDSIIPSDYQCVGVEEAKELSISYHIVQSGDNVLEEIHE